MKEIVFAIMCVFICILMLVEFDWPKERYYDCRLAEIHPDYPQEVKQACRKLNSTTTKNYI